jgi:hypothetical protein
MLRIAIASIGGLLLCTMLSAVPATDVAHAQKAVAKKKAERKVGAARTEKSEPQERATFTAEEEETATITGIPDARAWGDSESGFVRLLPRVPGPWLVISGGGSDGAFAGGVLAGWTQNGARPDFAVVSGSSIGSLIAPFAFLGSRYDDDIRKNFTAITAADVFEDRATRDSLFDHWPLKRQIEERVSAKLLTEIASEHERGRRLFVVTTSLDTGRRVIWNMGAIAARGDERALKLFRDILLASCSIPGFFSPVTIEVEANGRRLQEMHSDGTLTAPFFVIPESMLAASNNSLPAISALYVLVNSKLDPEFKMPDADIPGVLGRSISVALTSALRAQVSLLRVGAQRHGIPLRVAHIDPQFNHPSRGPFDGKYMQALYEFALEAGKKGNVFEDALPNVSLRGGK